LLRISPSSGRSNKIQIAINPRERDDAADPALWIVTTAAIVPVITVPRDIPLLSEMTEEGRESSSCFAPRWRLFSIELKLDLKEKRVIAASRARMMKDSNVHEKRQN